MLIYPITFGKRGLEWWVILIVSSGDMYSNIGPVYKFKVIIYIAITQNEQTIASKWLQFHQNKLFIYLDSYVTIYLLK